MPEIQTVSSHKFNQPAWAVQAKLTRTFESVRLGHRGQQSNVRYIELMLEITHANDLRCSIRHHLYDQ